MKPLAQIKRQEESQSYLVPASVKGWVQNQSIAMMDPLTAYQMDNFFPEASDIRLRHGSQIWAIPPDGTPVETVMSYLPGATGSRLFAATNGKIYDISGGGVVMAVSGLASNRWNYINYANAAFNWLVAVNGVDPPELFNGSTWAPAAITGPNNIDKLSYVWEFAETLFFVEGGTQNMWYLAPLAVQGAATQFPLGALLDKGGALLVGGEWTIPTTTAIINLCVFISTEGEVLVYEGTSPASSTTWGLVGRFTIGRPIGQRCLLNMGSDLIVLCEDGLMPLSKALQFDRATAAQSALTWNIQDAFNDAYHNAGTSFGWQIFSYPLQHNVMVNVPYQSGGQATQFVENVVTGGWCRFLGMYAVCWCVQQDNLYFGGYDGNVWQANVGCMDGTQPINATWVSAFGDLGATGRLKAAKAARVIFIADAGLQPYVGVSWDYTVINPLAPASVISTATSLWDLALWDVGQWDQVSSVFSPWVAALGEGYQGATTVGLNVSSSTPTVEINCRIVASYILFEGGTWLG